MMKKLICSIFLLLILGLVACRQHPHVLPLLQEADTLMFDHPDSSLILLESVLSPETLSAEDYATWCLLITQARDKNYVTHTSDSLIDVAVRYFEKRKDPLYYAKALYYKGRVFQDQGKTEEATTLFVKALDVGKDCQDYNLLFLISSRLGTLYGYQDLAEALKFYQKAYQYAIQSGDSSCLSYAYSYMGRAYGLSEEWEQSLNSYEKALSVATRIDDTQAMELAMNEYVAVCVNADRSDKIANYVDVLLKAKQEYEDKIGNLEQFYLTTGNLYRHVGKYDEAILYLKKTFQSENLYTLREGSQSLYFLYEELKQYDKAVQYNNQYWAYTDSIRKIEGGKAVMEVEAKYNHEKLQKENLQLKLKNLYWGGGCIIGLFVISGVVFVIVRKFRHRMKDKKRLISELERRLLKLQQELDTNSRKQAEIQLKVSDLTKQLDEKSININQMQDTRISLLKMNKKLEDRNQELKNIIALLRKNITDLNLNRKDVSEPISFALLVRMKKEEEPLCDNDWDELFAITDFLYQNFVTRLLSSYPNLKLDDLKLCCLAKQKFTDEQIASFLNIQKNSVVRKKERFMTKLDVEDRGKNAFDAFCDNF